jgi:phosphopantetheinyl transferase (holo-ACP synthase)
MMDKEILQKGRAVDIIGLGTEIVECARVRASIDEHAVRVVGRGGSPWAQVEVEYKGDTPSVKLRGVLRDRMAEAGIGSIMLATAFSRHYATATAIALRAGL